MAKLQCSWILCGTGQCIGEAGHPGQCVFPEHSDEVWCDDLMCTVCRARAKREHNKALDDLALESFKSAAMISWFPPGMGSAIPQTEAEMYGDVNDPLKEPLPVPNKAADWSAKDRAIEWVRANFTPGMLAKLYKLSYDVDGMRRDKCDESIRKG